MTCLEIECACARLWNIRQNMIVPNVSWGAGVHECDLLILSKTGYAVEIEIKVTKADLIKDANKKHAHISNKIKHLYFAIPEKLLAYYDLIPSRAGIIIVKERSTDEVMKWMYNFRAEVKRYPETNKLAKKWEEKEIYNLARLGTMRIWGLKEKLSNHKLTRQLKP